MTKLTREYRGVVFEAEFTAVEIAALAQLGFNSLIQVQHVGFIGAFGPAAATKVIVAIKRRLTQPSR